VVAAQWQPLSLIHHTANYDTSAGGSTPD